MIQTKECPQCEAEHRLHVKRCGCGHVFEFKQSGGGQTISREEVIRQYDARVKKRMAEFKGTPAKEFKAATPSKLWAYRILDRVDRGETLPPIAIDFAKQVVGE